MSKVPHRLDMAIFTNDLIPRKLADYRANREGRHLFLLQDDVRRIASHNRKIISAVKKFGWSSRKIVECKKAVSDYTARPSLRKYLRLRKKFPEMEIEINAVTNLNSVLLLKDDFKKENIEPDLVEQALLGSVDGIEALAMRVLELLVLKSLIPKSGPGHIQLRRRSISEAMINYLIVLMMEAFDWNKSIGRMPRSLVLLVQHHLGGASSDLNATYLARERRSNLIDEVAELLRPGEKLSIRTLARIAGMPRGTAAHWLADNEFKRSIEIARLGK